MRSIDQIRQVHDNSRAAINYMQFECGFVVYLNQNRSALVRDLLSYNSLFVGQLYEDTVLVKIKTHFLFHGEIV